MEKQNIQCKLKRSIAIFRGFTVNQSGMERMIEGYANVHFKTTGTVTAVSWGG